MLECKLTDTLMQFSSKLGDSNNKAPVNNSRHQRLVRKLIYLSHTKPDISFTVSVVSQFLNKLSDEHMETIYRILRYIKMAPSQELLITKIENK